MSTMQDWSESRRPRAYPLTTGIVLAAIGLLVWAGFSAFSGAVPADAFDTAEGWDTQAYLAIGLPTMALAVVAASFYIPERTWRWPLWLATGHQAGILMMGIGAQSGPSLILLAVILGTLLAATLAVPALAGSMLARRVIERAY